ncbi:hypothetical protein LIER_40981 [Lithospermum erythrorhizon]|uniref:DUF4220 domain-containing protein n=1 Tax=Lithospermum erythrorhizon TaxID=34254 RepID=A0AAV3R633_LITER
MLTTVASVFIFAQRKILVEIVPDVVRKTWKDWEVRVLILFSLFLQIILIWFGNRRKFKGNLKIRSTIWTAYLLADWVATVTLGVISQNTLDECKKSESEKLTDELMALWAPFLLIHLGGPDTITAYSLEDNELWLRHLVGLVIHSGLAVYVLLVAWPGSSYLIPCSLLILLSGLVKYAERTLSLRSANFEHLRNSMLTPPDAGPNYAKFMEEYTLKKMEGFFVKADEVKELPVITDHKYTAGRGQLISKAFDQFEIFKRLFVDLILSFQDRDASREYFRNLVENAENAATKAFDVIDIELSFAFDMFFTKAPVIFTAVCGILRLLTFCFTIVSMIAFWRLCESEKYHVADIVVTYLLHLVAIFLEFYAVHVLINSDWMDNWLSKRNKPRKGWISRCFHPSDKPRWSNSMAQYNLLQFCLEDKPARLYKIQEFFHMEDFLEKHRHRTYVDVSPDLKRLIFHRFNEFAEKHALAKKDEAALSSLVTRKGSFTIEENGCPQLNWTFEIDFDERILVWHIATDLCYYLNSEETKIRVESKHLSDYMLYLLVMCPFMLPMGIGMIRYRDTCAEARDFFKDKNLGNDKLKLFTNACEKIRNVNTEVLPRKVKGDRSKSVLFDACRLAKSLLAIEDGRKRWEIIFHEWVELAAYAAGHCRSNHHAQQLRKGGEFLTHIWLLMVHLGITDQFQISQGHARAKLIVK